MYSFSGSLIYATAVTGAAEIHVTCMGQERQTNARQA